MSAGKNARLTALKALLRVEEGKGYSNLVLDHGLAASGLDGRDAAFARRCFTVCWSGGSPWTIRFPVTPKCRCPRWRRR